MDVEELMRTSKTLGLGDDGLHISDADRYGRTFDTTLASLRLGMVVKMKYFTGATALWDSTFLSGRFYPCQKYRDGKLVDTTCLGPCLGRVIVKYGWYVSVPAGKGPLYVRGDALGRRKELQFIPFLAQLNDRLLTLTRDIDDNKALQTMDAKKRALRKSYDTDLFVSPRIWEMLQHVYGLTTANLAQYEKGLSQCIRLQYVLDYPPLIHAARIDGCLADPAPEHDDSPPAVPLDMGRRLTADEMAEKKEEQNSFNFASAAGIAHVTAENTGKRERDVEENVTTSQVNHYHAADFLHL
jgi:hypothetical protein